MARKRIKRVVPKATVHIKSTFNNTVITFTDENGDTLCWSSPGVIGNKGAKKSTAYAAQKAAEDAAEKAKKYGVKECKVKVKGPGSGRAGAIRSIEAAGITVRSIEDETPLPHNGCRPPKKRRV